LGEDAQARHLKNRLCESRDRRSAGGHCPDVMRIIGHGSPAWRLIPRKRGDAMRNQFLGMA
jgi:hypothetical protein